MSATPTSPTIHHLEVYSDRGEVHLRLVCDAAPDAFCRKRPKNDRETFTHDDDDLEPGHECWATEWIGAVGWHDGILTHHDEVFARIPVERSYDEAVVLHPVKAAA